MAFPLHTYRKYDSVMKPSELKATEFYKTGFRIMKNNIPKKPSFKRVRFPFFTSAVTHAVVSTLQQIRVSFSHYIPLRLAFRFYPERLKQIKFYIQSVFTEAVQVKYRAQGYRSSSADLCGFVLCWVLGCFFNKHVLISIKTKV